MTTMRSDEEDQGMLLGGGAAAGRRAAGRRAALLALGAAALAALAAAGLALRRPPGGAGDADAGRIQRKNADDNATLELPPRTVEGVPKGRGGELRGHELMAAWTRARDQHPALFEPTALRQEDQDMLAHLNRSGGGATRSRGFDVFGRAPGTPQQPPGWAGPKPSPPSLWGGPSVQFAAASFTKKVTFPTDDPARAMDYAGPGSDIPEGLWGIWWMDQAGFSSVAKDPDYPFAMIPTPEMLASFGSGGADTSRAHYEKDTRCVTPIECYGGPRWAAFDNGAGNRLFGGHGRTRNTMSFCYGGDGTDHINIFQKMLWSEASVGAVTVGPWAARALGCTDAGLGYTWINGGLINMTMERRSWGWDRVTTVLDLVQPSPLHEAALQQMLPSWLWQLVKMGLAMQKRVVAHYPLLQIVDGEGKRTEYFDEWLAFSRTKKHSGNLQMKFPGPMTGRKLGPKPGPKPGPQAEN